MILLPMLLATLPIQTIATFSSPSPLDPVGQNSSNRTFHRERGLSGWEIGIVVAVIFVVVFSICVVFIVCAVFVGGGGSASGGIVPRQAINPPVREENFVNPPARMVIEQDEMEVPPDRAETRLPRLVQDRGDQLPGSAIYRGSEETADTYSLQYQHPFTSLMGENADTPDMPHGSQLTNGSSTSESTTVNSQTTIDTSVNTQPTNESTTSTRVFSKSTQMKPLAVYPMAIVFDESTL